MKTEIVVVVSSHFSEERNVEFIKHIENTIGVKHRVVCYPNFNQYSLPELYNTAVNEYSADNIVMVFCHNDIIFQTKNWGKLLLTKFNSTDYQIIGVAGTTYLHETGVWWQDKSKMVGVVEHTDGYNRWVSEYSKPQAGKIQPVVAIDGLFMAIDCDVLEKHFDEDFRGFHFYDLPICVNTYQDGFNIGVTTDIRILHNSIGEVNEQWETNRLQFSEKYKEDLPLKLDEND